MIMILCVLKVCRKSSGLCNIYGSLDCEGCMISKCKIGYKGDRCQFCSDASTLIEGTNGKVDSKGAGVKCGKFQCNVLLTDFKDIWSEFNNCFRKKCCCSFRW